jgi:hypothetical protein
MKNTSKPIYKNEPKELEKYITAEEFENFYVRVMYNKDVMSKSHKSHCTEEQMSRIEFFIKSPGLTPAIKGYIAVAIPCEAEGNNEVGLVGYVPVAEEN